MSAELPVNVLNLMNTRIRGFSLSSTRPVVNEVVVITGYLDQQWGVPPFQWWGPLDGTTVYIRVNEVDVGSVVTDEVGYFRYEISFPSVGTYRVKAVYKGDFVVHNACASDEVAVTVITEEQRRQEQETSMVLLIAGGAVAALLVGVVFGVVLRR